MMWGDRTAFVNHICVHKTRQTISQMSNVTLSEKLHVTTRLPIWTTVRQTNSALATRRPGYTLKASGDIAK